MEDSERQLGEVWKDPVRSKKRPWFVKTPNQVVHYDQRQKAKRTADMYLSQQEHGDDRPTGTLSDRMANKLGVR